MNIHWKYILYSFAAALLTTACSKDSIDDIPESEKTSIQVTAEMATGAISAQSRAGSYTAGTTADFADGKKFAVAVYRNGDARDITTSSAHKEIKMGTTIVTYHTSGSSNYTYSKPTGESSLLYWDDFGGYSANLDAVGLCTGDGDVPSKLYDNNKLIFPANNSSEDKEDNIKTIDWALDNTTGYQAYKAEEDLCVSGYLTDKQHTTGAKGGTWPVCEFNDGNAFKHVLSKITVSLTADPTSYGGSFPSGDTKVTIKSIVRKGSVNIFNRTVAPSSTDADKIDITANATRTEATGPYTVSFLAMPNVIYDGTSDATEFMNIVVPSTISGQVNNYSVPTQIIYNLLKEAATEAHKSDVGVDVDKKITLKSGVHYYINLIVKKQAITVVAQIKNWDVVETDPAEAPIVFENDITSTGAVGSWTEDFVFYRYASNEYYQSVDNSKYTDGGSKAYTYDTDKKVWGVSTAFYWESSTQQYYFRALYPSGTNASSTLTALEEPKHNDKLILWGTTKEHTWNSTTIGQGYPVHPRTGAVEMQFYPIMSMIEVIVKTTEDGYKVDLSEDATVTITGTAKTGTINLHNGVTPNGTPENYDIPFKENIGTSPNITKKIYGKHLVEISTTNHYFDYIVPQVLHDNAKIQINLNTPQGKLKYERKLKDVLVQDPPTNYINEWKKGERYIYTLKVKKTGIEISAQLVDWTNKEGEVEVPFM